MTIRPETDFFDLKQDQHHHFAVTLDTNLKND